MPSLARRLPGDALVKLEAGVRLGDEVPVRHRPETIVPTGWSGGRGDYLPFGGVADADNVLKVGDTF